MRAMRRDAQRMSREQCEALLKEAEWGILCVSGDDGVPYGVPVNYCWWQNAVLIHSALSGEKIEALRRNPLVSFTVVGRHEAVPAELTTLYTSVMIRGRAVFLADVEKMDALTAFIRRFRPDDEEGCRRKAELSMDRVSMIRLEAQEISGKMSRTLAQEENPRIF